MKILELLVLTILIFSCIIQTHDHHGHHHHHGHDHDHHHDHDHDHDHHHDHKHAPSSSVNLYELLQIAQSANSDQIKKAFRRLSIKYHPDRNQGDQSLHKKFIQIKRAYQILIDVSKRNTYDLFGQQGLAQIQKHPKPKGGDFRTQMTIPLAMFYKGGQNVYGFRRGEICKHCKGTGDISGQLQGCTACKGTGKMIRQVKVKDQVKEIQMKCKQCSGTGHAGKEKCPICAGEKIVLKPRDLKFQVQRGMRQGDKILFKGQSQQGFQFYPGDVYLTLKQQPHSVFKRIKNNLFINLDITLKQALLGFEKKIKHLDGHQVQIVGDYNVQDGQQMIIKGEGMPIRGQFDSFGDLLAKVNIRYPRKFTNQMLNEMKEIFNAGKNNEDLQQL